MAFSATFAALHSEAYLVQGCLSVGLTALRNAQLPNKSEFYTGFFNTSIALERVLKLVFIIDRMRSNSFQPPQASDLKALGHDLIKLYQVCEPIAARVGVSSFQTPTANSIEGTMLDILSGFARTSRYYNLDSIGTKPGSPKTYPDPLAQWNKILLSVIESDVPAQKVHNRLAQAEIFHALIKYNSSFIRIGMDGQMLSGEENLVFPAQHELAASYAMVRVFSVIWPPINLLGEIARKAFYEGSQSNRSICHVPLMHEFFTMFNGSAADIRRKNGGLKLSRP